MNNMFEGCIQLESIFVSYKFKIDELTNDNNMFSSDIKIKGGSGTTYNSLYIDSNYAHIDGGTSNPGYFTLKQ